MQRANGQNAQPRPDSPAPAPPIAIPEFRAAGDPETWIKPGSQPLEFRTARQTTDVTLKPLNSIFGRRYSVYWRVT
jgi:hypothetical protein